MDLTTTLVLFLSALALAGYCVLHQRRPRVLGEVSIFPSTLLLGLAVTVAVVSLAHLLSLVTGVSIPGRTW